ncbi:MAG: hypothetical protein V1740_08580 [Candidatus Woesearchaeota archaeon]
MSDEAAEFLLSLDVKSKNICKKNLKKLDSPYPERGIGDKEKLVVMGEEVYRLHIGRTYTAFIIAGLLFNAWQLTRRKLKHIKESCLYTQILTE